jgi:hypothetical protein
MVVYVLSRPVSVAAHNELVKGVRLEVDVNDFLEPKVPSVHILYISRLFEFIFGIKTDKAKSGRAGVNPTIRDLLCFHYFGWMSTPSMASHLASKYFL